MYYPKKKIRFGVQMGLLLLRVSVKGLESCLSWWENEISNALGDHRISNPESGLVKKLLSPHPEPDCFPLSPMDLSSLSPNDVAGLCGLSLLRELNNVPLRLQHVLELSQHEPELRS